MTALTYDIHSDLVKACTDGDLNLLMSLAYNNQNIFQKLISGDLNYPFKNKYGSYKPGDYLYIACENNNADLVKQLIKFGAENKPYEKLTPLLNTCKKGYLEVLQELVSGNIELHNEGVFFKDSPIFFCCRYGHIKLLAYIVEKIPDILSCKAVGSLGECPKTQHIQIWSEITRIIIKEDGVIIGTLLLFISCLLEHKDMVEFLVSKGVDINTGLSRDGFYNYLCPFSVAMKTNNMEIIEYLWKSKAEITESIAIQNPEITGKLLESHAQSYSRTYSVKVATKKKSEPKESKVLYWDNLGLHKIHFSWLETYGEHVARVDIHANKLSSLPMNFFELIPNLEDLDVSCNTIEKLPEDGIQNLKITRIIACSNNLTSIPIGFFLNIHIVSLDVSRNKIISLPSCGASKSGIVSPDENFWNCPSLKVLKLSKNLLTDLPKAIQGAKGLEKLFLDENRLSSFETIWSCPLTELNISNNELHKFSGMTQLVWSKTLNRLNLSKNNIKSISTSICDLQNLQYLDLSHNYIKTLPPVCSWKCSMLVKLNLSHNEFTGKSAYDGMDEMPFVSTCEFPVDLFQHTLERLDLSNNNLQVFPNTICELTSLQELDLSRNHNLKTIPNLLGKLKNIWTLKLAGLNVPELSHSTFADKNLAKEILPRLRAKLRKSVSFNRMKLMIVGLQGRGKTTLLAAIRGKQLPENISTVGITVEQFDLPLKSKLPGFFLSNQKQQIKFSAWDLAGQQVYYATHQCFLSGQTLYLVVFNVTHGKEGIADLAPWLANIQARAKNSRCIIVGSHTDCMPSDNKKATLAAFEKQIHESYYKKKGFPELEGYLFISSVSGEGIEALRHKIYNVAEEMNSGVMGIGGSPNRKMAPLSYVHLYDEILKEKSRRINQFIPPILTTDEMLELADKNPQDNDIFTVEELVSATKFLHENGILLHFDDHLHELNNLYFIDPSWLIDMFAVVVTIPECNRFVQSGYIDHNSLIKMLSENPQMPENFVRQYLRLLERFEIALSLGEKQYLIPAMLPTERPELVEHLERYVEIELANEDKHFFLNRTYHMGYIPAGFWSRLIARIMIAVQKWGMFITDDNEEEEDTTCDNYEHKVWREGVLVTYDDGFFLVESFDDDVIYPDWSNKGVVITVWSLEQDFSVMGFIVDHLDMLITEWYPGLDDVDNAGCSLVQKLVACPICQKKRKESLRVTDHEFNPKNYYNDDYSQFFRDIDHVTQFYLLTCASAATNYQAIMCNKHPDHHVDLNLLVPDLMLSDLPPHLVIDPTKFIFTPSEETRLGEGGAGGVYRGGYKGNEVAVKQFHSATKSKKLDKSLTELRNTEEGLITIFTPTEQSIQEQLEDTKIIQAFWELRQEVSMLCRLQHPNIIQFIGVCHSPLCFALELAPLGSLQGILEKKQQERDVSSELHFHKSALGRFITYKIAFQVIDALYYLHDSEIVYRDLKSDNVLVWSLDPEHTVNVKLSDYGIATFATPQGVIGEGGTPGFQAPEIKYAAPYDEKVDIFSYGIWLYELMSGYRPFRKFRTASEMKKAIMRGVRPSLRQDSINSDLPFLECIMEDCWQDNANNRPSSEELAKSFIEPDMFMLHNIYPPNDVDSLQKVRVVVPWNGGCSGNELLLWSEHEADRKYQFVDIRNDRPQATNEKSVPGPRVLCACQVEDQIWLGNEGCEIEVFGKLEDQKKPSILWKFAMAKLKYALDIKTFKTEKLLKVFASLVDGHLCIFTKYINSSLQDKPIFNETLEDRLQFEKDKWDLQDLNLGTKGYPAKCVSLVQNLSNQNKTELWVGSGSLIVIVDPQTNTIKEHIETTSKTNRLISLMTSDGVSNVWTCERGMSLVVQWDVASRTKLFEFQCNNDSPLNRILIGTGRSDSIMMDEVFVGDTTERTIADILDIQPKIRNRGESIYKLEKRTESISITNDNKNRRSSEHVVSGSPTKFKRRNRSDDKKIITEEIQKVEDTSVYRDLDKADGFVQRSLQKKPSLMYPSIKGKRASHKNAERVHSDIAKNSMSRPRGALVSGKPVRVTGILYAKNALWVGRNNGDVLVVAVDDKCVPTGKVVAVLGGKNVRWLGGSNRTVTSLLKLSSKEILALVKFDSKSPASPRISARGSEASSLENYQLLKFDVKSISEIKEFTERQTINHKP